MTLAAIADLLNSDGIATAQGGAAWYPSSVRAVLDSLQRDAERAAVLAGLVEAAWALATFPFSGPGWAVPLRAADKVAGNEINGEVAAATTSRELHPVGVCGQVDLVTLDSFEADALVREDGSLIGAIGIFGILNPSLAPGDWITPGVIQKDSKIRYGGPRVSCATIRKKTPTPTNSAAALRRAMDITSPLRVRSDLGVENPRAAHAPSRFAAPSGYSPDMGDTLGPLKLHPRCSTTRES